MRAAVARSTERLEQERQFRVNAEYREGMVSRSMGAEFLQERASKVDAQFRKIAADAVGRYTEDAVLRAVQKTSFGGAVEDAVKQALVPLLGGDHAFTEEAMEEKRKRQRLSEPQGAALLNAPQARAGQPGGSGSTPGLSGEAPRAAAVPGGSGLKSVSAGEEAGPRRHVPGAPGYNPPRQDSRRSWKKRGLSDLGLTQATDPYPFVTEDMREELRAARLSTCQALFVRWVLRNVFDKWKESGRGKQDWMESFLPGVAQLIKEAEYAYPDVDTCEFSWEKAVERCRVDAWKPSAARSALALRGGTAGASGDEGPAGVSDRPEGSGESGDSQGAAPSGEPRQAVDSRKESGPRASKGVPEGITEVDMDEE